MLELWNKDLREDLENLVIPDLHVKQRSLIFFCGIQRMWVYVEQDLSSGHLGMGFIVILIAYSYWSFLSKMVNWDSI